MPLPNWTNADWNTAPDDPDFDPEIVSAYTAIDLLDEREFAEQEDHDAAEYIRGYIQKHAAPAAA